MDMTVEQFEELGFAIGEQIKAEKKQKSIRKRTRIRHFKDEEDEDDE